MSDASTNRNPKSYKDTASKKKILVDEFNKSNLHLMHKQSQSFSFPDNKNGMGCTLSQTDAGISIHHKPNYI